jgi:glucosylceramidase
MNSNTYFLFLIIVISFCFAGCSTASKSELKSNDETSYWLTTADKKSLLEKHSIAVEDEAKSEYIIEADTAHLFQSIDGFGCALTGGSAYLINQKLDSLTREALLKELFAFDEDNIGISYLRISIGASDLDDEVFTYLDLPAGKTDPDLKGFSIAEDRKNLIPILKKILQLNPDIKIMGSPWTAPAWMKTNNHPKGGSLKPEYYSAYAQYFVKYIQAMKEEGINIDAVTLQNEPENPNNTPSMIMTAEEQIEFVKMHLAPAFEATGIATKIVVFDHNCDHPEYPITILNDEEAKDYIDGSAFHLYIGDISAMSKVHEAHPDRNLYFTEQWTSGKGDFAGDLQWHVKNLIIGATRNWSRNVLEWNLAADPEFNPHTDDGGCKLCQGAITIGDSVTRNVSYYIIAHASKFVRPGSVRIASNYIEGLPNVAFRTPEGGTVFIVLNESKVERMFSMKIHSKVFNSNLSVGAVATYVIP